MELPAGTPAEKVARLDVRRSTRHRRLRGEKTLSVNATNTLKDLKVMVRKPFISLFCITLLYGQTFISEPIIITHRTKMYVYVMEKHLNVGFFINLKIQLRFI